MALDRLIPPQPYNPSCPAAVDEIAIDMDYRRSDMLLIMEELVSSVKDDKKTDTAMTRLVSRIVDSLLWKLFKIICMLFVTVCVVVGMYCVYYFWIRDDVDNIFTKVVVFFRDLISILTKIVQLIEKIYDILIDFGEGAEVVVEEMRTHVMTSEDQMDALFMAVN